VWEEPQQGSGRGTVGVCLTSRQRLSDITREVHLTSRLLTNQNTRDVRTLSRVMQIGNTRDADGKYA